MLKINRLYSSIISDHLSSYRQMAFVSGPRQVGKTTTCREIGSIYLNWDNEDHREVILKGADSVARYAQLHEMSETQTVIVFDELHKYARWKQFIKGFFDTYEDRTRIIVTGSSRLNIYRRGGDSLMGRYFLFHMHPLSVAEIVRPRKSNDLLQPPIPIQDADWKALWVHGGFPEPFVQRKKAFSTRWLDLRQNQLVKEDLRDLTRIQELGQIDTLARLLVHRSGEQITYSALSKAVRISENTVRSWIAKLSSFHYGFMVRPWYKNINKSLRKEPKWFLRDWSGLKDPGKRFETFCACHLLKAVEGWTDLGLGTFELRYVRDKQKREVDFLVVRDEKPWFLVEGKLSKTDLSPHLDYFQKQTGCPHAFQAVMDLDYVDKGCFAFNNPMIVPARTLLSQLL